MQQHSVLSSYLRTWFDECASDRDCGATTNTPNPTPSLSHLHRRSTFRRLMGYQISDRSGPHPLPSRTSGLERRILAATKADCVDTTASMSGSRSSPSGAVTRPHIGGPATNAPQTKPVEEIDAGMIGFECTMFTARELNSRLRDVIMEVSLLQRESAAAHVILYDTVLCIVSYIRVVYLCS